MFVSSALVKSLHSTPTKEFTQVSASSLNRQLSQLTKYPYALVPNQLESIWRFLNIFSRLRTSHDNFPIRKRPRDLFLILHFIVISRPQAFGRSYAQSQHV